MSTFLQEIPYDRVTDEWREKVRRMLGEKRCAFLSPHSAPSADEVEIYFFHPNMPNVGVTETQVWFQSRDAGTNMLWDARAQFVQKLAEPAGNWQMRQQNADKVKKDETMTWEEIIATLVALCLEGGWHPYKGKYGCWGDHNWGLRREKNRRVHK